MNPSPQKNTLGIAMKEYSSPSPSCPFGGQVRTFCRPATWLAFFRTLTLGLLWAVVLVLALPAGAQRIPLSFHNLNTSHGLCSNYVKGITQDHRGCLWVATEAGLARFDGSGFTTFRRGASGICSDELNDVYYHAATHQLWIASQRDGISVYDVDAQRMVAHYTASNGLITNDVTHIGPAADGGIWITHYHLGMEHFNPATGRFTHYDSKSVKGYKGLRSWVSIDDGHGHLLIGHDEGGMSIIDLRTRKLRRFAWSAAQAQQGGIPGPTVHDLFVDRQGRYWVGTSQGLALFNLKTGRFTTFRHRASVPGSILSDQVMSIGQTRNGDLWVCTDMGGVSILRAGTVPAEGAFENYSVSATTDGLSSPNAYDFFEDTFGNVWIGNYRSGIDYVSHMPSLFTTLPYARLHFGMLTYKPVWGLNFDASGRLWLGGENELCSVDGLQPVKNVDLSHIGSNVHVNTIYRAADGMLWLGFYGGGMATFNPTTGAVAPVPMPVADATVNCFVQDTDRLWVGTEQGLFFLRDGHVEAAGDINRQLADLMIRSLVVDAQGKLWVGTFGRGVFVVNKQGRVVAHVENGSGLLSNAVNQLLLADDGSIWAATRRGLAHFQNTANPKQVSVFDHSRGLSEDHVHAIAQDADGNIWLSTNSRISRFNVAHKTFDNFASREGIPSGDFVSASVAQSLDGHIFFGSLSGVCRFNPAAFKRLPKQTPVGITGIEAIGAPSAEGDSIAHLPLNSDEVSVAYDRNTIRLTFNVADVAQAPFTEYAYCVEEFGNAQWLSTQGENHVTFRDLAPGTYTLHIRSRLAGQDWNPQQATLRMVVEPPFWLAWWAKLIYALLFIAVIWWVMRSYKHKTDLESRLRIEHHRHMNDVALNQERLRFYTNITHELRTPLTLIVGPLDDMSADPSLPAPVASKLTVIRRSANRLLGLVNELLEFRKTETQNRRLRVVHGNLAQTVGEIVVHFKELNRRQTVEIITDIAPGDYTEWFDPEIVRIALDNFLSNAMKYTPQGTVTVSLSHEELPVASEDKADGETARAMHTVIRVSDTGYGIPAEALPHLFQRYYQADGPHQVSGSGIGLALVKAVADLHHASVGAANRAEGGSEFTFALLTGETYEGAEHLDELPVGDAPTSEVVVPTDETSTEDVKDDAEGGASSLPTLLVVEDNADLRDYIRQSLCSSFRVLTAVDGQKGLARAHEEMPDVVVTDVMMPVMDGIELCRRLKADEATSHIPVILLTARDLMQDKAEGYAAGADSYLTKPFSARLLLSRISNLLQVRRQLAEIIALRMAVPPAPVAPAAEEGKADAAGAEVTPSQAGASGVVSAMKPQDASPDADVAPTLSAIDRKFLTKLDDFVLTHLEQEKLDVGYIASEMCMSHSTLYRKVKALIGISVNEYVRRTRLRRAAELLAQGDCTVAEVADRTGFSTPSYFRQCFKDAYGITPSDYASGKRSVE